MANGQESDKFLGIKKETLWKAAGYTALGLVAIGLLAAVF